MENLNLGRNDKPWNNLDSGEAENENDFFICLFVCLLVCSFYPPENVITLFINMQFFFNVLEKDP